MSKKQSLSIYAALAAVAVQSEAKPLTLTAQIEEFPTKTGSIHRAMFDLSQAEGLFVSVETEVENGVRRMKPTGYQESRGELVPQYAGNVRVGHPSDPSSRPFLTGVPLGRLLRTYFETLIAQGDKALDRAGLHYQREFQDGRKFDCVCLEISQLPVRPRLGLLGRRQGDNLVFEAASKNWSFDGQPNFQSWEQNGKVESQRDEGAPHPSAEKWLQQSVDLALANLPKVKAKDNRRVPLRPETVRSQTTRQLDEQEPAAEPDTIESML